MLADRWTERSLGELITLEYGAGLPQAVRTGEGYPVYGSSGLVGRHSDYLTQGPGIIVGRKGTVGAVVWSGEAFWPIDTTYYVEPRGDTNLRWIYWCLSGLPLNKLDSSTGVPGLNRHDAYALQVLVPPLPEQRCIAEILDAADEAIRQTERVIAKLKAVKAGLLHDLLTHGLDDHGRLRDPQVHPEQFKDSPLGRIPREWDVAQFQEYAISSAFGPRFSSDAYSESGNVATLRTTDMDDEGNIDLSTMPIAQLDLDRLRIHLLEVGDLLISRSGTCGITAVFPGFRLPVLPGAFLIRFRLSGELHPQLVRSYFNSVIGRGRVLRQAQGGVQKNLQGTALLGLLIPVPPSSEQCQVLRTLETHDARIRAEEAELAKLRQVKRGLMDDLLTGRVRVGG